MVRTARPPAKLCVAAMHYQRIASICGSSRFAALTAQTIPQKKQITPMTFPVFRIYQVCLPIRKRYPLGISAVRYWRAKRRRDKRCRMPMRTMPRKLHERKVGKANMPHKLALSDFQTRSYPEQIGIIDCRLVEVCEALGHHKHRQYVPIDLAQAEIIS